MQPTVSPHLENAHYVALTFATMRRDNLILAGVLALIAGVLLATRFRPIPFALRRVRGLYLRRIPLLAGTVLFAGPIASGLTGAHAFTEAFYDVQPWGVFFCTLAASVCAWTTMVTDWTTRKYGPQRFEAAGPVNPKA